jgi:hypothetical protein
MADLQESRSTPQQSPAQRGTEPPRRSHGKPAHRRTGAGGATVWYGWILFVGIILFSAGLINVMEGLVALFDDDFYPIPASRLAIDVDYTAWGWTLVALGAVLTAAGYGVLAGYTWARVVGVLAAAVNALVNLGFAAAYPVWTVLAVAFDVIAMYVLIVHGGEAKGLGRKQR